MTAPPSGWTQTTIGEIATLVNGRAFKPGEWTKTGLPIIRIQNLNKKNSSFNYFSESVADRHLVRDGDLLFAWSGTPGSSFGAHIWRGPTAVLNQHIFNVQVDHRFIDREFLCAAINQTLDEQIAKAHGGAGLRHVTKGAFEATKIMLPPIQEQRRIMIRLRAAEERSSNARSHLDKVLALIDTARPAILQSAFDLTLLSTRPRPLGVSTSSAKPLVSVKDIAVSFTYGSSSKSTRSGKIPVLRMGNIQSGELDWSDLVFTSDEQEITRYALLDGDILFNRTNSPHLVGKTAVYRGERPAIFANYLIRIRCSPSVLPEFLAYCLNSPAGRAYCQAVKSDGVSQSNVNATKLAAFQLRCPSVVDQREIVDKVELGFRRLTAIVEQCGHARKLLEKLHHRFIQQALTGRFSTSNPEDTSAATQVRALAKAKSERKLLRSIISAQGGNSMNTAVIDILRNAGSWLPSQELARLFGITSGASNERVEKFYAELRELDVSGQLQVKSIKNEVGMKIGDSLKLKVLG